MKKCSEAAGQLSKRPTSFETNGDHLAISTPFHRTWSRDFRGMVRDNANDFYSNANSTPIQVLPAQLVSRGIFQRHGHRNHGPPRMEVGVESDNTFLHENFNYIITDPTQFDDGTPASPSGHSREATTGPRAVCVCAGSDSPGKLDNQCGPALGPLSVDRQQASRRSALCYLALFSVRRNCLRIFPMTASSRRRRLKTFCFPTPFEVKSINPTNFLRLPVEPSEGNYYEAGVTKAFSATTCRLDANYFRRLVNNYADDDQIDNTTISFPIAFRKSMIYGAEAKIDRCPNGTVFRDY